MTGTGSAVFIVLACCCMGEDVITDVADVLVDAFPVAVDDDGVMTVEGVLAFAVCVDSATMAACWTPLAVVAVAGASLDPPPPPQAARINDMTRREG